MCKAQQSMQLSEFGNLVSVSLELAHVYWSVKEVKETEPLI